MHGHYQVKYISRGGGYSASEHAHYLSRTGPYAERHEGERIRVEPGNLPSWTTSAQTYFAMADRYSRVNATLVTHSIISFPRDLSHEQHQALVRDIAQVTVARQPYLAAIHTQGAGPNGEPPQNPHAHLSWSNKIVTPEGYGEANAKQWFKPFDREHAARSGAPVNQTLGKRGLFYEFRQAISDTVNCHLTAAKQFPSYYLGASRA